MTGLVYRSTGSWYILKDEEGVLWNARIKGKLKIDDEISSTNPIAIGDYVAFDIEEEATKTGIITRVNTRNNYIVRVSPHNKHQKHIVAANLDKALVVVTIAHPRTSQGFIDRFLLTAEAYHVPAIIVFNKIDMLRDKDIPQMEAWVGMYEDAGYKVFALSALDKESVQPLVDELKDSKTLFCGHSGVGKSTLINQLIPGVELRTGEVSDWSGKGQHTTTFAEMFDLPGQTGKIIDTPGVKEFGLIDMEREEVSHYFPEIRKYINDCRFNNCMHTNEPGCAVMQAVRDGAISEDRYVSYVLILDTIEKKWS